MKWFNALFKFFASLRLAVSLIVVLGIAFGAGTFIESYHGTHAAQVLVYRTRWMGFLFILLALNLFASALDRLPWKKKHVGFLTTHLGIILMLSGALVTQVFGVEGQVQIQEGNTETRMTLPEPLLHVMAVASGPTGHRPGEDSGQSWVFPIRPHVFPWSGREKLHADFATPISVYLLRDYQKAKREEEVEKTESGSPALHVFLKGSMASVDEWLFLDRAEKDSVQLGPATIRFAKDPIEIREEKKTSEWGALKFDFESGGSDEILLDSKSAGKAFPLKSAPYRVQVHQIFKDAVVEGNQLVERSVAQAIGPEENPAVQLTLEGKNLSERHTIFAKFPEFPTLHGLKPSEAHVRIAYEVSGFSSASEGNEIRFVYQSNGLPEYQVRHGKDLKSGKVVLNQEVETGWMDFKFTADQYLEHATIKEFYTPLPNISERVEAVPVVQIELEKGDTRTQAWLIQGEMTHALLGESNYHAVYGLATKPLGFQVELKDFMMDTDPGTDRPASFKSLVKLKDPMRGIEREQLIQMNEPLKYRGFKLYQSAYHVEPGRPDISIFTAARDPGNPLKYTGAIVMVLGILMLFYMKQFSTLKGSDPKLRSK
ncbi:MAG: cytochrome c biogenesis protein ResB [Candidatus Omnitrophica bacterium]|nr:cytochrome c biogenesis protein ResB [Candidatus Omnitrophota bacterium]